MESSKLSRPFFVVVVAVAALSVPAEAIHMKDPQEIQYPPCFFNPLCTCSKAFPDLGRVTCRDVPLYRIPQHINSSKAYMLHLENNGLRTLEPHFLRSTGLYSIEISRNSLTEIPPEGFAGLERSLWELNLGFNHLREVPSRAIRNLQKLKSLDLSDNEIAFVNPEDWKGLEESLEVLTLRGNDIIALHASSFSPLRNLEALDLSGNALFAVDGNVFRDGPVHLARLNLEDNLLSKIPYQALSPLKNLRHLDLSLNQISEIVDPLSSHEGSPKGPTLNLDTLRLDYNQIQFLPEVSFKYFATLNRTYFNGNPISDIQENAFRDVRIRELYLRDCDVSELEPDAFAGLETSLRVLDLAGNNLTTIPESVFKDFHLLRELSLEENPLAEMEEDVLNDLEDSLHELDLSGDGSAPLELRKLGKLSNIRVLALSRIADGNLSPEDFEGFSIDFEELRISGGEVKALKNHAFRNVRRLKRLDLSENLISSIESDAFAEVGHFLQHLCLAHGLSPTLFKLSADSLRHLTALQHLDASNNRLKHLDESSFHSMKQLKTVQLQDNQIESVPRGLFQDDVHSKLTAIYLSFNLLSTIASGTFADLDSLEILRLDDNRIQAIEKKAFMNLDRLKHLNLRGNKIESISYEAFENLPELEDLDLAYNKITEFAFSCLDQVGILSSLSLNVSHNSLDRLSVNTSSSNGNSEEEHETIHVNVKIIDFSHNNISYIARSYFRQIESSLTHLYLSHNALRNITEDALGNMIHLQWLDLSHNDLKDLDQAMFKNSKSLQVLKMSDNHLADVPRDIFGDLDDLRVIELADNSLKSLPDMLFKHRSVERLDLSGNQFVRVPASSFKGDAAASLMELDLSGNLIMSLHSIDIFLRFQNLNWLDLSSNPLIRIENGAFSYISHLSCLDLSNNIDIALDLKGRTFFGLDDTLEDLFLRNLSLGEIPELHLPHLKSLDLSDNEITTIPAELSQNLPSLRSLELSGNQLTAVPPVINTLTHLQYLGLADNDIESVSFHRGSRLKELDIRNLPITYLQTGILEDLQYLQTLRLTLPRNLPDFSLSHLLQSNQAIEHVYLEAVDDGPPFGEEMKGTFPSKLRRLTLTGKGFKIISNDIFQGITSPRLHFVVFNTSVEDIPETVFESARTVRNLTIDVRLNGLRSLGNPNSGTKPNVPGKAFLLDLKMAGNKWTCDCELGWIEGWDRKRRQYICEEDSPECYEADDDLRLAQCDDKKSKSLLETLKTDLECGWDSKAVTSHRSPFLVVVSSALILVLITKGSSSYL